MPSEKRFTVTKIGSESFPKEPSGLASNRWFFLAEFSDFNPFKKNFCDVRPNFNAWNDTEEMEPSRQPPSMFSGNGSNLQAKKGYKNLSEEDHEVSNSSVMSPGLPKKCLNILRSPAKRKKTETDNHELTSFVQNGACRDDLHDNKVDDEMDEINLLDGYSEPDRYDKDKSWQIKMFTLT